MVARLFVLAACISAALANPAGYGGFLAGELVGAPAYGLGGFGGYGAGYGAGYGGLGFGAGYGGYGAGCGAPEYLPTAVAAPNPIIVQVPPPPAPLIPGFPALGPSVANAAVPCCGGPVASASSIPSAPAHNGYGYISSFGNFGIGAAGAAPIAAFNEIAPVIAAGPGCGFGNGFANGFGNAFGNGYGNGYGYGHGNGFFA